MYSRNQRGQRERPLQIPENYGGSFLFPNTRMPNPPPMQRSDDVAKPKAPSYRRQTPHTKGRTNDEMRTEGSRHNERNEHDEQKNPDERTYQRERPWYDGNVYGLRGERERNEREHCDEYDECDKYDGHRTEVEYAEHSESGEDAGCDECEGHSEHEDKIRPSFPAPFSQGLLPLKLSEHFPFGHGLGFEELFLLGLILVLLREDADEQVIILLIILLFCG